MNQVPRYFEYLHVTRGKNSGLHPFSYDQEEKAFSIGDKSVALAAFDPYTYNPADIGLGSEGIPVDDIPEHAALLPAIGGVIIGPKLHEWAESHPEELNDTYRVMAEVFSTFLEEPLDQPIERSASHMGFSSGIREHGGIGLQVFGNCACMGPDPYGNFIEGQFEYGFAEYYLHNADSQSQRASLYAGIGHLARLASSENS